MTEANTPTAAKVPGGNRRKRTVATVAVIAVLLAGGITATGVTIARADAEETARQCAAALKAGASAAAARTTSIEKAGSVLEDVTSVDLPGTDGWTSTPYAERPSVPAVQAVPASDSSEEVKAVPARPSAAELIATVTDARAALTKITIPTECEERDEAVSTTAAAKKARTSTSSLDDGTVALRADFSLFQTEEIGRITAEKEAARKKAEAEAAAKKAAEEAAQKKAAEEAAKKAASRRNNSGSGGGTSHKGSGGGTDAGGGATEPAPRPRGGGGVGPGGDAGGKCWTSNGKGGLMPC